MMLLNFFIVIAATFVSVDADDPYIPCKSFISFSYDDSNFVRNDEFKTQMNFIKNAIGALNHPERLRAEGAYTAEFNWNSGLSIAQEQSSFDFSQQTLMAYSLLQQFASLVTSVETLDATDDPIAALIFISDTSDRALANAARFLPQLSCIQITFILFGPNADQNKLTNFSSNFISWRNLSQAQPDNWDSVLYNAYGCSGSSSTVTIPPFTTTSLPSITTTTTMSTGTGSTTPMPYMPCQSWISFSYDDSNTLPNNNFKTQMSFISTFIGSINYPNRLRIQGAYTDVASWYSGQSIAQMQTEINNTQQTDNKYSLLMEFATLVNYLPTNDWPVGALIFISDTSDQALRNAYRFMPQLSSVQLTFVLLGSNVDSSKLTNFSSNFIYWSDLSKPKPDNWDTVALTALGCTNPSSVSLPQLTTTTTTISRGTGSTTPMPYMPCQSWISFSYDDSNTLPNNNFKTHMCFISTFIGSINYPNRFRIQGAYTDVASWYSGQSIVQMQTEINNTQQTVISYSLLQQFAGIVNNLNSTLGTNWPIGAMVFISDTSDHALRNAMRFMPIFKNFHLQLTFVLLGPNVDSSKLTNFSSNFIYWSDLSKPKPDNWDTVALTALGCTNPSSVSLPPSTTMSTVTDMPYLPCQSWISFSYDDSYALENANYRAQMSFISSAITNINYPDRLRVNGVFTNVASFNSHQTISQMQAEIISVQQTAISYSLLQEFGNLLTDVKTIENNQNWTIGALIFISDTSDSALANANIFFSQLPPSVKITFVLLGPTTESTKLTQFSTNFIYWKDFSQPQPDSWDTLSYAAFGCQQ